MSLTVEILFKSEFGGSGTWHECREVPISAYASHAPMRTYMIYHIDYIWIAHRVILIC